MKPPYFACRHPCDFETESQELADDHIEKRYTAFGEWHTVGIVGQVISVVEVFERKKQKERKW